MILTKIIKTDKVEILVIGGLPEDAIPDVCCGRCSKPNKNNDGCWSAKECSRGTDYPDFVQVDLSKSWAVDGNKITLSPGEWQPLGFLKDITEDEAKELVDKEENRYFDYEGETFLFKENVFENPACQSLHSLVEANCKLKNKYGEIRPELEPICCNIPVADRNGLPECCGIPVPSEESVYSQQLWDEQEETVFTNPFLLRKID